MLISPPISASIRRGNDLVLTPILGQSNKSVQHRKASSSSSPSPIYLHSHPMALAPEALEARKLVAECAAYATNNIPGFTADPTDMVYDPRHLEQSRHCNMNTNHDYDLLNNTMMLEPPTPTPSPSTASTTQSPPSSPLSRDGPADGWGGPRDTAGMSVLGTPSVGPEGGSSSSQSTRPASPSWISPSSVSFRTESVVTWADEDPNYTMESRAQMKKNPGKTLVVYNTMSSDALKQQTRIAKRLAAMHRRKHRAGTHEESAMFMDPATGQTVHGDMMGLNIRPIPPDSKPKVTFTREETCATAPLKKSF